MALQFKAYIANVTSRKALNAKGQPVTYYSAFAVDAEPNPAAGACPYEEWLTELSEQTQQRISLRVFG